MLSIIYVLLTLLGRILLLVLFATYYKQETKNQNALKKVIEENTTDYYPVEVDPVCISAILDAGAVGIEHRKDDHPARECFGGQLTKALYQAFTKPGALWLVAMNARDDQHRVSRCRAVDRWEVVNGDGSAVTRAEGLSVPW